MAASLLILDEMLNDLRYAVRTLMKHRSFALVAVLSLGLGIGATTAIFRIMDAVRLRSLPVSHPEELARIRLADASGARGFYSTAYGALTNPIFEQVRRQQEGFTDVAAWSPTTFNLAEGGEVRPARSLMVSGGLFDVLGVRPALGRLIAEGDDRRGCAPTIVLSHTFWQREFGGDRAVVGRRLSVDGHPAEIIGVGPAGFFGLEVGRGFDLAVPLCAAPELTGRNLLDAGTDWWLIAIGRMKPGWTLERATTQLQAVSPGLFESTLPPTYPADSVKDFLRLRLEAVPGAAGESNLREQYEAPLWMLMAAAGLVLVIACANVANLLLARASAREREIAIRLGLGASRGRIVRQLLTESALLAAAGAAAGVLLADVLSSGLVSFLSTANDSVVLVLQMDRRVLGFVSLLGVATCLLFGLVPALKATSATAVPALRGAARGVVGAERGGLRRLLVIAQVAFSLVLLAGGVLFARSLFNLLQVDTGFRSRDVLVATVDLRRLDVPVERRLDNERDLLARIRSLPGVRAAATATIVPISGNAWSNDVALEGTDIKKNAQLNRVSPDYFRTLGIPLLAGRDFNERDTPATPLVAIVDEAFAAAVTGGASPLGRRVRWAATPSTPEMYFEIIGVAKSSVYENLREPRYPTMFVAASQAWRPAQRVAMLINADAASTPLAPAVIRKLAEIDPRITVTFLGLDRQIQDTVVRERLLAMLAAFFAVVAALLALLGLYGVIAYGVARRTNEIGLRVALGATRPAVLSMVLREGAWLVGAGVAVGLVLAVAAGRLAQRLLFGIVAHDPWTLGSTAAALIALGLLATYWPARAAARIEPTIALRSE